MKLNVPFVYDAKVVKPRCRKPSRVLVRDSIEIEIAEVSADAMPVALVVGNTQLRYDGERLWDFEYCVEARKPPEKVSATQVKANTESGASPFSAATAQSPFYECWVSVIGRAAMCAGDIDHLPERDDIVCREWIGDSKAAVVQEIERIAGRRRIIEETMYTVEGEPRYVVMTFGLGNNHGGTGMSIDFSYNTNIPATSYFRADQYDEACAYADEIATRRGDDKSCPVRPSHKIEVLIPEAVKLSPRAEHGGGCEFINQVEAGIQAGGPAGGILAMVAELHGR